MSFSIPAISRRTGDAAATAVPVARFTSGASFEGFFFAGCFGFAMSPHVPGQVAAGRARAAAAAAGVPEIIAETYARALLARGAQLARPHPVVAAGPQHLERVGAVVVVGLAVVAELVEERGVIG